jgi:hypothetical protein
VTVPRIVPVAFGPGVGVPAGMDCPALPAAVVPALTDVEVAVVAVAGGDVVASASWAGGASTVGSSPEHAASATMIGNVRSAVRQESGKVCDIE